MTPENLFDLKGKVALVTGGATGIGRMASIGLASAGARVFIASRKAAACQAISMEINRMGLLGSAEGFGGDVSTQDGISNLIANLKSLTSELHILINNAGRTWGAPLGVFPYDAWEKVIALNVTGMFHLTQGLIEPLAASTKVNDPARVINIGSVMGEVPMGDGAYSYSASKSAVHHLTRIMAKELIKRNITVNALAPGPFQSEMTKFATADDESSNRVGARVPAGRIGRSEDIAACMQFLCGYGGSYITGAIIPVSGGINVSTGHSIFGED